MVNLFVRPQVREVTVEPASPFVFFCTKAPAAAVDSAAPVNEVGGVAAPAIEAPATTTEAKDLLLR